MKAALKEGVLRDAVPMLDGSKFVIFKFEDFKRLGLLYTSNASSEADKKM